MNQKLFEHLQKIISDLSINTLKSIYPEQLCDWLDASDLEIKEFIEELYSERLITYKYKFQCKCGNNCTAYLRKLQRSSYVCNDCGAIYNIEEVQKRASLVYELEKGDILNFKQDIVDFKQESFKYLEDKCMSTLNKDKQEERQMEIFLGSSSEAIGDMERIGYLLEQKN